MTRRTLTLLAGAGLLLLGGCDYFGTPEGETASGNASGEILEPSVSDAMIPTDDLTSQPPALQEAPATGASGADRVEEGESEAAAGDSEAPAADEAAPAAAADAAE